MKRFAICGIFLLLFIGVSAQERGDKKVFGNIWVKDTVKGTSLAITNATQLGTVAYLLEDTAVTELGYDDDDFIVAGAVMKKKLNLPDTLHAFRVASDWLGTGAGSGFTFDIFADTALNATSPLITVANDLNIGTNGARGDDSINVSIPPGYWIWSEVVGSPSVTPTTLSISLLHSSVRGYTRSVFYGAGEAACETSYATAFWRFENNTNDEKSAYALTANGGATYTASACNGSYSGDLNGSGRYFSHSAINLGNDFTIAARFNPLAGGSYKTLYSNIAVGTDDGFEIQVDADGDDIYVLTGNGSSWTNATALNCGISLSACNDIVVVFNRSGQTADIYLDGVDVTTSDAIRNDFDNNGAGYIGRSINTGGSQFFGYVDEMQIALWSYGSTEIAAYSSDPTTEVTKCE